MIDVRKLKPGTLLRVVSTVNVFDINFRNFRNLKVDEVVMFLGYEKTSDAKKMSYQISHRRENENIEVIFVKIIKDNNKVDFYLSSIDKKFSKTWPEDFLKPKFTIPFFDLAQSTKEESTLTG